MERTINAPVDKVFALLTDAKWLETRYLTLGDLSASCKVKKTGGVVITMKRRILSQEEQVSALRPSSASS